MIDPWRWCDADDDMVADFLAASVEGLLDAGGWIHPAARLVARQGQIRIECDAPDGEPLVVVPRAAFLRVGRVHWSPESEVLAIESLGSGLAPDEVALLFAQIGLHNACGKIPWIAATHPAIAPDMSAEVIDAVRALQPSFRRRPATPAELLWNNRCFKVTLESSESELIALPVLDLLNHHAQGATGTFTGDAFSVVVRHATGTAECFLDYGLRRDAVEMAIVYGYADLDNPWAHSAPLTVDVPGVGDVVVRGSGRDPAGVLHAPTATRVGDRLEISHLTFGDADPVGDLERATGEPRPWCAALAAAIADANIELVERLLEAVAGGGPAERILDGAAARQLALLRR